MPATPGYFFLSFSISFSSSSGVIFRPELASYEALLEAISLARSAGKRVLSSSSAPLRLPPHHLPPHAPTAGAAVESFMLGAVASMPSETSFRMAASL